ncbi:Uncharacterised protein [Vibrio cholerae]|nr:Uncharacterised protein [Vibrio cholerae]
MLMLIEVTFNTELSELLFDCIVHTLSFDP